MKTTYGQFMDMIKKHSWQAIWEAQSYFKLEELVPKKEFEHRGKKLLEIIRPKALLTLLEIRILMNNPIQVNTWLWNSSGFEYRGWRPPSYYLDEQSYSQHIFFNAFDFDVKDKDADEVRQLLYQYKQEGKLQHLTGIEEDVSWIHIDCRESLRLNDDGLFLFKA